VTIRLVSKASFLGGTFRSRVLPPVLDFLAAYPEMRVDLVTEGRLVDKVAEGFDAGIRLQDLIPKDMVCIPLGQTESFVLVASRSYLEGRAVPASQGTSSHTNAFEQGFPAAPSWIGSSKETEKRFPWT